MKKLLIIAALLLPFAASAQDYGVRASAGGEVKLFPGLHLSVDEELRTNAKGIDDIRTTLGLSYKINKTFKVGGGYVYINPYKIKYDDDGALEYRGFWYPKHRVYADVTGTLRFGDFQLSLKEKLQLTHRTDDSLNVYQSVRNALALRSRIGIKYKGFKDYGIEPFGTFEMRTALNEPWGEISGTLQTTDNSNKAYYAYTHTGYTHVYNNRYRVNLGADWSPAKNHTFTASAIMDFCSDYVIDTNSPSKWAEKGVRLFTETTGWEDSFGIYLGLGYKFSF